MSSGTLLLRLRSAWKRARSHGTKPSLYALFRCFQWRVYNAGRCADGEVASIGRARIRSPVSARTLVSQRALARSAAFRIVCSRRFTFAFHVSHTPHPLALFLSPLPLSCFLCSLLSLSFAVSFCETRVRTKGGAACAPFLLQRTETYQ